MFIDCKYTNKKTNHKEISVFFSTKQHTGPGTPPQPSPKGRELSHKKGIRKPLLNDLRIHRAEVHVSCTALRLA